MLYKTPTAIREAACKTKRTSIRRELAGPVRLGRCTQPLLQTLWKSAAEARLARERLPQSSMELSSADQIEQEFADELQSMSLQEEEAAPIKKPVLERGFSEIDPHNEAAARGTSAQKQGSFSARQLPDEPSYRVALQSRYGSVAPPLARTFTERDPSSPISPAPKVAPKPPARTFTEPERPFPPTEPANKEAFVKAARDAIEVEAAEAKAGETGAEAGGETSGAEGSTKKEEATLARKDTKTHVQGQARHAEAQKPLQAIVPGVHVDAARCGVRRGLPLHSTKVGRDAVDRPARGRLRGALQQTCGIGGDHRQ